VLLGPDPQLGQVTGGTAQAVEGGGHDFVVLGDQGGIGEPLARPGRLQGLVAPDTPASTEVATTSTSSWSAAHFWAASSSRSIRLGWPGSLIRLNLGRHQHPGGSSPIPLVMGVYCITCRDDL
jgi:hypothetical protein